MYIYIYTDKPNESWIGHLWAGGKGKAKARRLKKRKRKRKFGAPKGKREVVGDLFCDPIPFGNQTARSPARTARH